MKCKTIIKKLPVFIAVLAVLVFYSCSPKKNVNREPFHPLTPTDSQYLELISRGGASFSTMHLHGWRKAETFFSQAYRVKPSPGLRDKLFLALFLIAIREKDEKIPNPITYEKIDALGDFPLNPKQQYLFDIIRHYRSQPITWDENAHIFAETKKNVDITLFDIDHSALDFYLYFYILNYYHDLLNNNDNLQTVLKERNVLPLMNRYSQSPLILYMNFKTSANREEEIEKQNPEFAEFFLYRANALFQNKKLRQAAGYYEKALALIPGYTTALNGIGNIYFFSINDYETSIRCYRQTLDLDPVNPTALFGIAVSLHQLNRCEESDKTLDNMLQNQPMYHGEAFYYKAYNSYLTDNPTRAREYADKAKKLLPHSGEILYLSGLLFYNEEKFEEAEEDFYNALYDSTYSQCFPLYYLGMIKMKKQDWKFLTNFSTSIDCFKNAIRQMEQAIVEIDDMDIDPSIKEWKKKKETQKLTEYKEVSAQLIQQMETSIAQNLEKKKIHDRLKNEEALQQIKNQLDKHPNQLNAQDKEGSTLLHKAAEAGQTDVVEYLLSRGARMDIPDNNGYFPLNWAIMLQHVDTVRLFIQKGAPVTQKSIGGMTPLHDAAYAGNKDIVELLIAKGARLDAKDDLEKIPFELALEQGKTNLYNLLNPLPPAIRSGNKEKIRSILETYPSLLEIINENGKTSLHEASEKGDVETVRLLLQFGVKTNIRDIDGLTPLELALQNGNTQIAELLKQNGAISPNSKVLIKPLNERQAVLWYLGGPGWAVRTKNHFLIFDFQPITLRPRNIPKTPLLGNGQLSPSELMGQDIAFFYTSDTINSNNSSNTFNPAASFSDAYFVSLQSIFKTPKSIQVTPGENRQLDGIDVTALQYGENSSFRRTGYLIRVDGLIIFFDGWQFDYLPDSQWKTYVSTVESMVRKHLPPGERIDIAFIPVMGSRNYIEPSLEEKFDQTIRAVVTALKPIALIPLTSEGYEPDAGHFLELWKQKKSAVQFRFFIPGKRGDRFEY